MATQTLTLHLPDPLYARLQERARRFNRTLEAELLEVLNSAVPVEESLPDSLTEDVARLDAMDDAELWQVARSMLSKKEAARLEVLHLKRQKEGLSESEGSNLAELVRQYERSMLTRARAAALLKQRGHDVSGLVARL
jgi:plasmid stability protein